MGKASPSDSLAASHSLAAIQQQCDAGHVGEVIAQLTQSTPRPDEPLLQQLRTLASHSLSPEHLRAVLAHHAATRDVTVLTALADAADAARQLGVLGAPRSFLAFRERTSRLTLPLHEGQLGASGFVLWLWLRWEGPAGGASQKSATGSTRPSPLSSQRSTGVSPAPSPAGQRLNRSASAAPLMRQQSEGPESVCELLATRDHGLELLLVGGLLTVCVLSSKGGCSEVQLSRPLSKGVWHFVCIEVAAPERRWLPAFSAQTAAHAIGSVAVHVDGTRLPSPARLVRHGIHPPRLLSAGELELQSALEFPSPTASIRTCTVGASSAHHSFCGQLGALASPLARRSTDQPTASSTATPPATPPPPQRLHCSTSSSTTTTTSSAAPPAPPSPLLQPANTTITTHNHHHSTITLPSPPSLTTSTSCSITLFSSVSHIPPSPFTGELLLLPPAISTITVEAAAAYLKLEPQVSLREAAQHLSLRHTPLLLAEAPPPAAFSAPLVGRRFDVRDALVTAGGARMLLLLIGRLQLGAARDATAPRALALFLRLLRLLLWQRPTAQQQARRCSSCHPLAPHATRHTQRTTRDLLLDCDGVQMLGWLLLKLPPAHLSTDAVSELEMLLLEPDAPPHARPAEAAAAASADAGGKPPTHSPSAEAEPLRSPRLSRATLRPELRAHLLEFVLCDMRIWARAAFGVQRAHIALLRRASRADQLASPSQPPVASVLSVRLLLDALRKSYAYKPPVETGKRLLGAAELRIIRSELALLASEMTPSTAEVHLLVTQLHEGKDLAAKVQLVEIIDRWLRMSPDFIDVDGGDLAPECGSSDSFGGGSAHGGSVYFNAREDAREVARKLVKLESRAALPIPGGDSSALRQLSQVASAVEEVAQRVVVSVLDNRGGVYVLLGPVLAPHTELREASIHALAAYVRLASAGSQIADVDGVVDQLAHSFEGQPLSRSTCNALFLLAASPGKVNQLGSKPAVWLLLKLLPAASRGVQRFALRKLLRLVTYGRHAAHNASMLLNNEAFDGDRMFFFCCHQVVELILLQTRDARTSASDLGGVRAPHTWASLTVSENAGRAHVSLMLIPRRGLDGRTGRERVCSDASEDGEVSAEDSDGSDGMAEGLQLGLRLLAALLCHGLYIREGWKLLPLLSTLLDRRQLGAQATRILFIVCCRVLSRITPALSKLQLPSVRQSGGPLPASSAALLGENLLNFLHTLDLFLLRSDRVWSVHDGSHEVRTVGASEELHLLAALVDVIDALNSSDTTPPPPPNSAALGARVGQAFGATARSSSSSTAMMRLCGEAEHFRLFVQWLLKTLLLNWSDAAYSHGSRALARPFQLLFLLLAPVSSRHATPPLVLAVIGAISRLPTPANAMPLVMQLLHTPGPSGDVWHKLLPEVVVELVPNETEPSEAQRLNDWLSRFQQLEFVCGVQLDFAAEQAKAAHERKEQLRPITHFVRQRGVERSGPSTPPTKAAPSPSLSQEGASPPLVPFNLSPSPVDQTLEPPGRGNLKELDELQQVCRRPPAALRARDEGSPRVHAANTSQRKWVKLICSFEHERCYGVHDLLALQFPSTYPLGAPPHDKPPAARWKLDKWEGPQLPPGQSSSAGQGRLRLKMKRNFRPDDHLLASGDAHRASAEEDVIESETVQADQGTRIASPSIDEQELREEQIRQLISGLPQTEEEVESNYDAEEIDEASRPSELEPPEGGGERTAVAGAGLAVGGQPAPGETNELSDEEHASDWRDVTETAGTDKAVLLSLPCKLVRGMALQLGRLQVCARLLRFVPDAVALSELSGSDKIDWVRDGEPEVQEEPRLRIWRLDELRELMPRRYLLRRIALELFFSNGASHFLCFEDREARRRVHQRIVSLEPPQLDRACKSMNAVKNLLDARHAQLVEDWQSWRISNFEYLMRLNTLAGRSYNDLTQYPVMPWVLRDYTSATLDIDNREAWPRTFRDLSKPIGAQEPERAKKFAERFASYEDAGMGSQPFHYGSHYSSAGIVLYYLLRMEPFTTENIKLQGGRFDVADRQFDSIAQTWDMCMTSMSDVKELTPEFFHCAEFLTNANGLKLGTMQNGTKLGDVQLPPWASSADDFIRKHRAALESDYVSEHLHLWIDLIFGCKQRGRAAEEALNVFYYLTYEGNVRLESLDPPMRAAVEAQIQFFGQTPSRLLVRPHAKRRPRPAVGMSCQMFSSPDAVKACYFRVGARASRGWIMRRNSAGSGDGAPAQSDPIDFICKVPLEDKLLTVMRSGLVYVHRWQPLKPRGSSMPFTFEPAATPFTTLPLPVTNSGSRACYAVSGDGRWLLSADQFSSSLRCTSLFKSEAVLARQHGGAITCIDVGADGTILTGSADGTLATWTLYSERARGNSPRIASPRVLKVLTAHHGPVLCAALSSQLDLVLSGARLPSAAVWHDEARDGGQPSQLALEHTRHQRCAVWTASRGRFVRWIDMCSTPSALAISHSGSGLLVYSADDPTDKHVLLLFSINGRPLRRMPIQNSSISQIVCTLDGENVVCSQDGAIVVRLIESLEPVHQYHMQDTEGVDPACSVSAFSLCPLNHHAFVASEDGGVLIYANPILQIILLENIALELLNL
ncbi:hypothetical protein AB1Y20_007907 [Prymnesium parvum]|uniref:Uncharacterized protein n=1 Tax=Prymnesium parvum TaxID=97485 RepID=A0AB34ITH3_PRYPA